MSDVKTRSEATRPLAPAKPEQQTKPEKQQKKSDGKAMRSVLAVFGFPGTRLDASIYDVVYLISILGALTYGLSILFETAQVQNPLFRAMTGFYITIFALVFWTLWHEKLPGGAVTPRWMRIREIWWMLAIGVVFFGACIYFVEAFFPFVII
jgi:hypothetical protein